MNIIDISLIAETITKNNIEAIKILLDDNLQQDEIEVFKLLDISISQPEISSGNNIVIVRFCFEHPARMINSEIDEYKEKALTKLKALLEELISSKNRVYSIKGSIIKFS